MLSIYVFLLLSCKEVNRPIKFAIVSDLHVSDLPDRKVRIKLVVDGARKENVESLIQLGDFIRLDSLRKIWDDFNVENYHVLGNHDLDEYLKEEFISEFNMLGRYYSFDKGNFHFIIWDGNNLFDGSRYIPYNKANYYVGMEKKRIYRSKTIKC